MTSRPTIFGSLHHYEKGGVEAINADPKHYVFSNVFEVASKSKPYERVCVGKNMQYVIETLRAEGTSPWYAAAHDEAALCMDGDVEVHYVKPDLEFGRDLVPPGQQGAIRLSGEPRGKSMGWVRIRKGHMALLSRGNAYQFRSAGPSVVLIQTIQGDLTVERWAEICQTS